MHASRWRKGSGIMKLRTMFPVPNKKGTLYRLGTWVYGRTPKRFIYTSEYDHIIRLNERYERPDQEEAVRATLRRRLAWYLQEALESVPYYRETVKVRPEDIDESNAADALKEFPYLLKSTVMNDSDAFVNRKFRKESLTYTQSAGSTGQAIGLWRTKAEVGIEVAFVASEWGKFGLDWERSRIVRMGADCRKPENEDPFTYWRNRLYISPSHLHSRWMEEIYRAIVAFKPDFIWAYPSSVLLFAEYLQEREKPPLQLKALLLASENLEEYQYHLFKRIFNAPVSAHYGLTERTNMATLRETDGGSDFHYRLIDTFGYSENYRDELGNDEIVGTSYWNIAMPLIRYRTSDIGRIDENGIIRKIQGRTQDFFIDKKGRRVSALSVHLQKYMGSHVKIHQLMQNRAGEVIIRVVPKKTFNQTIKQSILDDIRKEYGEVFDARIQEVDEIEWARAGKWRVIVNNLKQQ
jgi:phenylacetate-coenzyme A ligase PaaK-like adenylate-forming protein